MLAGNELGVIEQMGVSNIWLSSKIMLSAVRRKTGHWYDCVLTTSSPLAASFLLRLKKNFLIDVLIYFKRLPENAS